MVAVPLLVHAGHLLIDVPLFLGPVILLVAVLAITPHTHGTTATPRPTK